MQYILLMAWGNHAIRPKVGTYLACFNGQNLSISVLEICRSIFLLYNSHLKKIVMVIVMVPHTAKKRYRMGA